MPSTGKFARVAKHTALLDFIWGASLKFAFKLHILLQHGAEVVMDLAFHVPSAFIPYFLFKPKEQWVGGTAFANASSSRSAKTRNKGCEKNISAGSIG